MLKMKLERECFKRKNKKRTQILKCFIQQLRHPNYLRDLMAHLTAPEKKEIIYSYVALNTEYYRHKAL